MAEAVAVIAAITALCAVVLGPLVSLWAAQKQTRVAVLANNRQAWINSLRDAFAEFVSLSTNVALVKDEELVEKVERLGYVEVRIKLMLNPKEADHQHLMDAVTAMRIAAAATIRNPTETAKQNLIESTKKLMPQIQSVLKREWERVKRVE